MNAKRSNVPEDDEDGADRPTLLSGIDSFANILNARDAMATEKHLHGDEHDQRTWRCIFKKISPQG